MNLPLQEIQEEYDHTNVQMYMHLQRELTTIQFDDPYRYKTVSITYKNLMQITYFLDMNSTVLRYSNYKDFHPSNWFFDSIELTDDKIGNFQWDTLPYKQNHSNWNNVMQEFKDFIQFNSNENETLFSKCKG
ncbi:Hypothetical protein CINCED_3A013516 [Cinara cedri]|uniref:Uncharacterized protein n=1 Tax=Cinara cedri TaxID=506608 RepID=A0A5E4MNL9_9HEMI|nr:Hypothetical protein CINCED_3A013516 [Cinara cedri]